MTWYNIIANYSSLLFILMAANSNNSFFEWCKKTFSYRKTAGYIIVGTLQGELATVLVTSHTWRVTFPQWGIEKWDNSSDAQHTAKRELWEEANISIDEESIKQIPWRTKKIHKKSHSKPKTEQEKSVFKLYGYCLIKETTLFLAQALDIQSLDIQSNDRDIVKASIYTEKQLMEDWVSIMSYEEEKKALFEAFDLLRPSYI